MKRASRCELRDRQGEYVGTFVTDRSWQTGDILITGDGRGLRVVGIATAPEESRDRPAFTGALIVEPVEAAR